MSNAQKSLSLNFIKAQLKHAYGTEKYYHGLNSKSLYTDGFKELIRMANCYWLYDIIQTEIFSKLKKQNVLDTFHLKISSIANKGSLELFDYMGNPVYKKDIPHTDFPEGELTIIVGWDGEYLITCLVSEN